MKPQRFHLCAPSPFAALSVRPKPSAIYTPQSSSMLLNQPIGFLILAGSSTFFRSCIKNWALMPCENFSSMNSAGNSLLKRRLNSSCIALTQDCCCCMSAAVTRRSRRHSPVCRTAVGILPSSPPAQNQNY